MVFAVWNDIAPGWMVTDQRHRADRWRGPVFWREGWVPRGGRLMMGAIAELLMPAVCQMPRPASVTCTGFNPTNATETAGLRTAGPPSAAIAAVVDRLVAQQAGLCTARAEPIVSGYRVMSTSGQHGAFGRGFLAGRGQNTAGPWLVLDVVTAAGAGGTVAPFCPGPQRL